MLKRVARYLLQKKTLELEGKPVITQKPRAFVWTRLKQGFLAILRRDTR